MKTFLMAVWVAISAVGAASADTMYDCSIQGKKGSHSVPDRVEIKYNGATKSAEVFDAFVNHYFGKPIAAEVLADNTKRLTIGWDFENIKARDGGTIPRVRMKASVLRASNEIHVTTSYGYGDSESGFGTCTVK